MMFLSFFKKSLFFVFYFIVSCSGNSQQADTTDARQLRRDNTQNSNSTSRTRCNDSKDGDLSITNADNISAKNAGEYTVSGRCSLDGGDIELNIEGGTKSIQCAGNRWETTVDVTKLVQNQEEVNVSARAGSRDVCLIVQNSFLCPTDYVPVSNLVGDSDIGHQDSFCVMKYEARGETNRRSSGSNLGNSLFDRGSSSSRDQDNYREEYNEKAVSKSNGEPWTNISLEEAKRRCRNNGSGYQLISNNEWQTIARNIELTGDNWSLGHTDIVSDNVLRQGSVSSGLGDSRASSSRSEDRRHILLNGEEVWDIAGGVKEIIVDTVNQLGVQRTSARYIYELEGKNKALFGPQRDYDSVGSSRGRGGSIGGASGLGLGGVRLSSLGDIIVRGGGSSARDAGIFAVDSGTRSSGRDIGFRCTYHP